jgi:hypothetical protein
MKLRKGLIFFFLATLAAGGVFAQAPLSVSVGLGGFMDKDFGGGFNLDLETNGQSTNAIIDTPHWGGGGYAFLDLTYIEIMFGIYKGNGKLRIRETSKENPSLTIQHESDISIINTVFKIFMGRIL